MVLSVSDDGSRMAKIIIIINIIGTITMPILGATLFNTALLFSDVSKCKKDFIELNILFTSSLNFQ